MIMHYFLCFLFPPIAVLTTGRVGSFILSVILTLLFWVPGIIYAILVVNDYYEAKRHRQIIRVMRRRY